tara:strand:+ start:501 stop:1361 length:861 start_codon:yes stop_codon:yes gene_type:complete
MLYLALVSLVWAFSFGLIGNTLAGVDPFFVASVRLGCASLLFLPFFRPNLLLPLDCFRLLAYGFVQFGLMYVAYMKAYQYLPSHLVALFSLLTPVYVVWIHNLRNQSFSARYLLAAILSIVGAAVIKMKGLPSGGFWFGFFLMQLSGIAFAFGQIAYRDWKQVHTSIDDRSVFALLAMGGAFCAGGFSLFFSDGQLDEINLVQWQSILYLGFIASGLGFFLWNKGASRTNPGVLAAFNNALVPLAMIVSLFVFGEIGTASWEAIVRLLIGGVLIAFAVWTAVRKES